MLKSYTFKKRIALTVYNDGFALVREIRTIPPLSVNHLIPYLEVPELIETNSLQVKGLQGAELNYKK
jgi:hypothetical protein